MAALSIQNGTDQMLERLRPEEDAPHLRLRTGSFLKVAASMDPQGLVDWKAVALKNPSVLSMGTQDMEQFLHLLDDALGGPKRVAAVLENAKLKLGSNAQAVKNMANFMSHMGSLFQSVENEPSLAQKAHIRIQTRTSSKQQDWIAKVLVKNPSVFLGETSRGTVQNGYEALFEIFGVDVALSAIAEQPLLLTRRVGDVHRLLEMLQNHDLPHEVALAAITRNPLLLTITPQMSSQTVEVLEPQSMFKQNRSILGYLKAHLNKSVEVLVPRPV